MVLLDFSIGKKLEKLIEHFAVSNLDFYREAIRELILKNDSSEGSMAEVNCTYMKLIHSDIASFLRDGDVSIYTRYKLVLMSPTLTGYEFDLEYLSPGAIYSFAYYSITSKQVKPNIGVKMNHTIYNLQQSVFRELYDENREKTDISPSGEIDAKTDSNSEMNGKYIYKYSDGRVYNGTFKDGKRNGKGILTFPDG